MELTVISKQLDDVETTINSVMPGSWAHDYWTSVRTRLLRSMRMKALENV